MSSKDEKKKGKGYNFPLKFSIPEDVEGKYATHLQVQHSKDEFIINFFEARPPIITGTEEEKEEQLEKMSAVEANCVARIIVSPRRMQGFIDTLHENFEKFISQFEGEGEEER